MTIFYMSARNVEGILQGLPGAGRIAHSAEFPAPGDLPGPPPVLYEALGPARRAIPSDSKAVVPP